MIPKAVEPYEIARGLSRSNAEKAEILFSLGETYLILEENEKAIEIFQESLELYRLIGDEKKIEVLEKILSSLDPDWVPNEIPN